MPSPKQHSTSVRARKEPVAQRLDFEPDYAVSETGTRHELRNGLLVPIAEDQERIDIEESKPRPDFDHAFIVAQSKVLRPGVEIAPSRINTRTVKANPLEMMRAVRRNDGRNG